MFIASPHLLCVYDMCPITHFPASVTWCCYFCIMMNSHSRRLNKNIPFYRLLLVMAFICCASNVHRNIKQHNIRKVTNIEICIENLSCWYEEHGSVNVLKKIWKNLDLWIRKVVDCYRQSLSNHSIRIWKHAILRVMQKV